MTIGVVCSLLPTKRTFRALGDYFIGDSLNSDSLTVNAATTHSGTTTNEGRALRQLCSA